MRLRTGINITWVLFFTPTAAPQRIKAKLSDRRVAAEGSSTSAFKYPVLPSIHRVAATIHVKRVMFLFQEEHKDRLPLMSIITDLC